MDTPSFDLRLVTSFCVLAEELHLGRAAERLGVSRRAVAAQLGDLERQLGTVLLLRQERRVSLTPAGEGFLVEARTVVERATAVATRLCGARGRLRVHVGEASNPVVRASVAAFVADHPEIAVHVAEGCATASVAAVVGGTADVGFDAVTGVPAGASYAIVDRAPLGVVAPAGHPVAGVGVAPWTALAGERVFAAPPGVADSYNVLVRSVLRRCGVAVTEVLGPAVSRLGLLGPSVSAGRGLVVCSRHAFVPLPPGLVWTALSPARHVEIAVIWIGREATPTTRRFVELARSMSPVQED